jgi:hypothetical protein
MVGKGYVPTDYCHASGGTVLNITVLVRKKIRTALTKRTRFFAD